MSNNIFSDGARAVRYTIAKALSQTPGDINGIIERQFGFDEVRTKAAQGAITAGDVNAPNSTSVEFMLHLIRNSAFAALLPAMYRTEFYAPCNNPFALGATRFVGQGRPIPVFGDALTLHSLDRLKTGAIAVFSKEALQQFRAEAFASAALESICQNAIDEAFLLGAGVAGETPQSITHGAATIAASSNPVTSIKALLDGMDLSRARIISDPTTCAHLGLIDNPAFADCGAAGGTIAGVPVITTASSPRDSNGGQFLLVDPSRILAALGTVAITKSDDASLEMQDTIDSNGNPERVGMFQSDSVALRVVLHANWKLLDSGAVRVLTGCDW